MIERRFRSDLLASPEAVWRVATSLAGINAELMPLMAMRSRGDLRNLGDIVPVAGVARFDAGIMLGGILPIGSVTIRLVELGDFRFVERSNQPGMNIWQHEREVAPTATGCALIDLLSFEPRMMTPISTWFVEKLFEHRHRRLRMRWGGEQCSSS